MQNNNNNKGFARRIAPISATFGLVLLAACSSDAPPPPQPVAYVPPPPPVVAPPKPVALSSIHTEAGEVERVFHLRAALNVAALQCGRTDPGVVKDYNTVLARHKGVLASAYSAKQARFQQTGGKTWQRTMDRHMTQLYNHWAWPPAQTEFCAAASKAAREAATVAPERFAAFAPIALASVDRPIAFARGTSPGFVRTSAVGSSAALVKK